MRRGIVGGAALGALIGACFSTPRSPAAGDDDAPRDGDITDMTDGEVITLSPDGDSQLCQTDLFLGSGSSTCGSMPWGTFQNGSGFGWLNGSVTGELVLQLSSGVSYAQCSSMLVAAWNRVTVDVKQLDITTTGETAFVGLASSSNTDEWGVVFDYDDTYMRTSMSMSCSGGAVAQTGVGGADRIIIREGWNPTAQRYLQIERTSATTLTFRASPDNVTYTQVGTCVLPDGTPFSSSMVRLRMKRPFTGGGSQTAQFGHIELCHDPL